MVPVVKRAVQLARINSSLVSKQRRRHLSQSVPPKGKPVTGPEDEMPALKECKRLSPVDTYDVIRRLKAHEVPPKEAVAVSSSLNGYLENIQKYHATLSDFEQELELKRKQVSSLLTGLKTSEDTDMKMLQHHFVARRKAEISYLRGELLSIHSLECSKLSKKLDKECVDTIMKVEATKYELGKYFLGSMLSVAGIGIAMQRYFGAKAQ